MAVQFEPPPTYAEVVLVDEAGQKPRFNPIWLKWFVDIAAFLTNSGGSSVQHNLTTGLQGGMANQYYHLTAALYTILSAGTTGSGLVVLQTSPTLITPTLGVAVATSLNGLTISTSTGTLTIANGKTLTVSNTVTFSGTDGSTVAFGAGGTIAYTSNNLSVFAATTSAQLAGVISDETGTGALVFANTPTLVTPVLGAATATSINFGGSTLSTYAKNTFFPTANSFTVVGTPTVIGRYIRIGDLVKYQILHTSTTTVASTAGTSNYTNLPFTVGYDDACYGSNANIASGTGYVSTAGGGTVYPATFAASSTLVTSFTYEV